MLIEKQNLKKQINQLMTYLLFSFKDEAIRYLYVNQQLVRPVHIDKFRKNHLPNR